MVTTVGNFTTKQYRHLVAALWMQRELGCANMDEAVATVRRTLILQKGVRRLLGELLGEAAGECASGWTVEFGANGEKAAVYLRGERPLVEALSSLVEQAYARTGEWPTGIRKGKVYVALG